MWPCHNQCLHFWLCSNRCSLFSSWTVIFCFPCAEKEFLPSALCTVWCTFSAPGTVPYTMCFLLLHGEPDAFCVFFLLQDSLMHFFSVPQLWCCCCFCCVNSVMCFIYSMNGMMCFLCSRYGPVVSVRMLPEKYCAFINFKLKESAGRAMQCLQVHSCCFIVCVCCGGSLFITMRK